MTPRFLFLLVPLLLAACGDLPAPFLGNPGATARRLAVPATPLLAIPPPKDVLLPEGAGARFAALMAERLQNNEIPALARTARKTDWSLTVSAARSGDTVVPRYAVLDPAGKEQGTIDGAAVPAAGWTAASPPLMEQVAADAADKVVALLTSVKATRDLADPTSLMNRVAKLYVPEVTGAPGDGNVALTRAIRASLPELGAAAAGHAGRHRLHHPRHGVGRPDRRRAAAGRDRLDGDQAQWRGGREGVAVERRAGRQPEPGLG